MIYCFLYDNLSWPLLKVWTIYLENNKQYLIFLVSTLRYCHVNDSIFKSNKEAVPGKPCSYLVVFFSALIKRSVTKNAKFTIYSEEKKRPRQFVAWNYWFYNHTLDFNINITHLLFLLYFLFFHGKWEVKRKVNLSACSENSWKPTAQIKSVLAVKKVPSQNQKVYFYELHNKKKWRPERGY